MVFKLFGSRRKQKGIVHDVANSEAGNNISDDHGSNSDEEISDEANTLQTLNGITQVVDLKNVKGKASISRGVVAKPIFIFLLQSVVSVILFVRFLETERIGEDDYIGLAFMTDFNQYDLEVILLHNSFIVDFYAIFGCILMGLRFFRHNSGQNMFNLSAALFFGEYVDLFQNILFLIVQDTASADLELLLLPTIGISLSLIEILTLVIDFVSREYDEKKRPNASLCQKALVCVKATTTVSAESFIYSTILLILCCAAGLYFPAIFVPIYIVPAIIRCMKRSRSRRKEKRKQRRIHLEDEAEVGEVEVSVNVDMSNDDQADVQDQSAGEEVETNTVTKKKKKEKKSSRKIKEKNKGVNDPMEENVAALIDSSAPAPSVPGKHKIFGKRSKKEKKKKKKTENRIAKVEDQAFNMDALRGLASQQDLQALTKTNTKVDRQLMIKPLLIFLLQSVISSFLYYNFLQTLNADEKAEDRDIKDLVLMTDIDAFDGFEITLLHNSFIVDFYAMFICIVITIRFLRHNSGQNFINLSIALFFGEFVDVLQNLLFLAVQGSQGGEALILVAFVGIGLSAVEIFSILVDLVYREYNFQISPGQGLIRSMKTFLNAFVKIVFTSLVLSSVIIIVSVLLGVYFVLTPFAIILAKYTFKSSKTCVRWQIAAAATRRENKILAKKKMEDEMALKREGDIEAPDENESEENTGQGTLQTIAEDHSDFVDQSNDQTVDKENPNSLMDIKEEIFDVVEPEVNVHRNSSDQNKIDDTDDNATGKFLQGNAYAQLESFMKPLVGTADADSVHSQDVLTALEDEMDANTGTGNRSGESLQGSLYAQMQSFITPLFGIAKEEDNNSIADDESNGNDDANNIQSHDALDAAEIEADDQSDV